MPLVMMNGAHVGGIIVTPLLLKRHAYIRRKHGVRVTSRQAASRGNGWYARTVWLCIA